MSSLSTIDSGRVRLRPNRAYHLASPNTPPPQIVARTNSRHSKSVLIDSNN